MYDLAAEHLETALHQASRHKAAVPGLVVDNSAKRNLTECQGRLSALEQVLLHLVANFENIFGLNVGKFWSVSDRNGYVNLHFALKIYSII
jgi:hypothetical protein